MTPWVYILTRDAPCNETIDIITTQEARNPKAYNPEQGKNPFSMTSLHDHCFCKNTAVYAGTTRLLLSPTVIVVCTKPPQSARALHVRRIPQPSLSPAT